MSKVLLTQLLVTACLLGCTNTAVRSSVLSTVPAPRSAIAMQFKHGAFDEIGRGSASLAPWWNLRMSAFASKLLKTFAERFPSSMNAEGVEVVNLSPGMSRLVVGIDKYSVSCARGGFCTAVGNFHGELLGFDDTAVWSFDAPVDPDEFDDARYADIEAQIVSLMIKDGVIVKRSAP